MNLKGFKKTQDDEHKAVLTNEKGHVITLAKKGLSKSHLDGLKQLPLHAYDGSAPLESTLDAQTAFKNQAMASPAQEEQAPEPQEPEESKSDMQQTDSQPEQQNPAEPQQAQAPQIQPVSPDSSDGLEVNTQVQNPEFQEKQDFLKNKLQEMHQGSANVAADIQNGHIAPQAYKDLMPESFWGKMGTLFGLMVSGAGSGLAHQPNAVLEMMNKELERNLEAQKESQKNKLSWFDKHQQEELNKASIGKTKQEVSGLVTENKILSTKSKKEIIQLGLLQELQNNGVNPIQNGQNKANAQQVLDSTLKPAVVQNIAKGNVEAAQKLAEDPEAPFRRRQELLRASDMPGAESIAKYESDTHLPGFGDASTPIPTDIKNELTAKFEYDKAARKYIEFAEKHKNNWANLNLPQRKAIAKQGAAMAAALQGKYRVKTHGGVYKTGEQEFIQGVIPDQPAQWDAAMNAIPKVKQTLNDNQLEMETMSNSFGANAPRYHEGSKKYFTKVKGKTVEVK